MKIFKVLVLAIIFVFTLFFLPFTGVAASVPCVITDIHTAIPGTNEPIDMIVQASYYGQFTLNCNTTRGHGIDMIVQASYYGQFTLNCNTTRGHGEPIRIYSVETRPGHRHGTGVITLNDVYYLGNWCRDPGN